jgi:hypothetical protein
VLSRAALALGLAAGLIAPAVAQRIALTPAFLVGRWGDNGDCTRPVVFRADGTFRTIQGGEGQWSLRRDRLTMTGERGLTVLRVTALGRGRLAIVNPDGSRGTSQRCPSR